MTTGMTILTDVSLIVCIVQRGRADRLVQAAQDAGAHGATVFFARGAGMKERMGFLGVAVDSEKEVIQVVCGSDEVTRVTERMYHAGQLDTPGMGFLYVMPLEKAATYVPSEVIERYGRKR